MFKFYIILDKYVSEYIVKLSVGIFFFFVLKQIDKSSAINEHKQSTVQTGATMANLFFK